MMQVTGADARRLAREFMERVHEPGVCGLALINLCREVFSCGLEAHRRAHESVSFTQALEISLGERAERRTRTLGEIRSICRRLLRVAPGLAEQRMRDITPELCREMLEAAFHTRLQFNKARTVLHAIFACGVRHGWCAANPVDAIPRPMLSETEVAPLPWEDLCRLIHTAKQGEHRACLPAVGMMLWAGVRPAEMLRLQWEDIDWQEKVINLRPRHSKTGGCRHITLYPVLAAWLKLLRDARKKSGKICPPNWVRRWRELRHAAGIRNWQQDVLRHTFASYHLKRWHDLGKLQEEMGHRSPRLLQTRYLSMRGITHQHALLFWTPGAMQ